MSLELLPKTNRSARSIVIKWIISFFFIVLILQFWKIFSLNSSYDQGLFLQEIWNTWQGRAYESTLASELSAPVKFYGEVPVLGYRHLAQHFTPLLIIWTPLVGILGVWALPIIQVSVLAIAGWILFLLGKEHLPSQLAGWIACSFFTTGTVIGPSLENFHDLCVIPLLVFSLLLGISKNQKYLFLIPATLLPLVREDVGILSFGIGLWMVIRRPSWKLLGIGLCLYSLLSVLLITNWIMPIFGSELKERFLQERFAQYLNNESGGTIDVLIAMARQPLLLIKELIYPPASTLRLFVTLGLPLVFIPIISLDSWLLIALPLFIALSSQGGNALSVHLRFMLYLVPGVFAGSIFWWSKRTHLFNKYKFQNIWKICISIALFFSIIGNPHRSLSAVIPDSIQPWVHIPVYRQFQRGKEAKKIFSLIPDEASVAAETHLIPQLAEREILIRFPESYTFKDRNGSLQKPDYIISQPSYNKDYGKAFRHHARWVIRSGDRMKSLIENNQYGVFICDKKTIVLKKGLADTKEKQQCLTREINRNQREIFNYYGDNFARE